MAVGVSLLTLVNVSHASDAENSHFLYFPFDHVSMFAITVENIERITNCRGDVDRSLWTEVQELIAAAPSSTSQLDEHLVRVVIRMRGVEQPIVLDQNLVARFGNKTAKLTDEQLASVLNRLRSTVPGARCVEAR